MKALTLFASASLALNFKYLLSFAIKGDAAYEVLTQKLSGAVSRTFPAAKLNVVAQTRPLIISCLKDKLPVLSKSSILYLFTCTCGVRYLGHTTRRLSKRVSEHCPAALRKGTVKTINSSILEHLVDSGHQVNAQDAFKIFYSVSRRFPKALRKRILSTAEAIAIRVLKPELCKQKALIQNLSLPWP